MATEEGLAAINQAVNKALDGSSPPYLYKAALHYYSAYMASLLSFEDLFKELEKFTVDPIERWKECVKVKRGLHDTSKLSGMYKDQVIFLIQPPSNIPSLDLPERSGRDPHKSPKHRLCGALRRKGKPEGLRPVRGKWTDQ